MKEGGEAAGVNVSAGNKMKNYGTKGSAQAIETILKIVDYDLCPTLSSSEKENVLVRFFFYYPDSGANLFFFPRASSLIFSAPHSPFRNNWAARVPSPRLPLPPRASPPDRDPRPCPASKPPPILAPIVPKAPPQPDPTPTSPPQVNNNPSLLPPPLLPPKPCPKPCRSSLLVGRGPLPWHPYLMIKTPAEQLPEVPFQGGPIEDPEHP
jgi:hypothetical protein